MQEPAARKAASGLTSSYYLKRGTLFRSTLAILYLGYDNVEGLAIAKWPTL